MSFPSKFVYTPLRRGSIYLRELSDSILISMLSSLLDLENEASLTVSFTFAAKLTFFRL